MMLRRSFLSALAAWFPGSTLLTRWAASEPEPIVVGPDGKIDLPDTPAPPAEHACPICENRRFNVARWHGQLEFLIRQQMPDVTFGDVELTGGKVKHCQISYVELSPTHAIVAPFADNGLVFAQEISTIGKIDDIAETQSDLPLIDERLSLVVPPIVAYLNEMRSQWGGMLSPYKGPIVCQIKEIEALRLQSTFASAIRGIIAIAPGTPPAKL